MSISYDDAAYLMRQAEKYIMDWTLGHDLTGGPFDFHFHKTKCACKLSCPRCGAEELIFPDEETRKLTAYEAAALIEARHKTCEVRDLSYKPLGGANAS